MNEHANVAAVSIRAVQVDGATPKCTVLIRPKNADMLMFSVELTETAYEAEIIGDPPEEDAGPYASIAVQAASSVLEPHDAA
jgi:hypothetical protein